MKARAIVLGVALCFVGAGVCFAEDAQMGTWKLNEAKSKFGPGTPKNTTVVYEAAGDNVKVTVEGTDSDGKPTHNEWTGKFDGKDYPVTGDPNSDARSYKKVNDRTLNRTLTFTVKRNGKVTITGWVRQPLRRGSSPSSRLCARHVESLDRHAHLRSPGTGGSAPEL